MEWNEEQDPMTTATARMFFERALKAEADVERLREYVIQKPYPSDVESLQMENAALRKALRLIASSKFTSPGYLSGIASDVLQRWREESEQE